MLLLLGLVFTTWWYIGILSSVRYICKVAFPLYWELCAVDIDGWMAVPPIVCSLQQQMCLAKLFSTDVTR